MDFNKKSRRSLLQKKVLRMSLKFHGPRPNQKGETLGHMKP